ncbi:UNVERIFIED_CONTAM: hypothetical protein Scaly_3073100 [Sesamum calycinum]|uniref:Endonuclease/exonuclease/phosphatase domain-containing protein n=1 Tax=Sesamum calycinum TaxID=2727403 RepID=A0AAW2JWQ2_9LAMI
MREDENPMHVDMDWCDFHIHVHDLPLNMMNLGVATLIGNRIGMYRDMETDTLTNIASSNSVMILRIRGLRPRMARVFGRQFHLRDVNNLSHPFAKTGSVFFGDFVQPAAMKFLMWNCQRLGSPWTVRTLSELVKLHRPGLVFLSETKCKSRRLDKLKEKLNYHGVGVDSVGKGGSLSLLWCKDIEVWLQSFLGNHIDATVKSEECPTGWRFTGFYGNLDVARQKDMWNLLRNLAKVSMRPWFCGGDFNEILGQHEKQGTLLCAQWQKDVFRACLSDCGLQDLGFERNIFIWSNLREAPHTVRARFDRAVNLSPESDPAIGQKRRIFRFEVAWLSSRESAKVVHQAWRSSSGSNPQETVEIERPLKQMHPLKLPGPNKAFSSLIRQTEKEGSLQGVAVSRQALRVLNLLFVDDTLIFCQATMVAFNYVHHILTKFEHTSGLKINMQRSAVVFSKNVEDAS